MSDRTSRILELSHSHVMALLVIQGTVISHIPFIHRLVETVQPIRSRRQVDNLGFGYILGDEGRDRVADEQICLLDVVP